MSLIALTQDIEGDQRYSPRLSNIRRFLETSLFGDKRIAVLSPGAEKDIWYTRNHPNFLDFHARSIIQWLLGIDESRRAEVQAVTLITEVVTLHTLYCYMLKGSVVDIVFPPTKADMNEIEDRQLVSKGCDIVIGVWERYNSRNILKPILGIDITYSSEIEGADIDMRKKPGINSFFDVPVIVLPISRCRVDYRAEMEEIVRRKEARYGKVLDEEGETFPNFWDYILDIIRPAILDGSYDFTRPLIGVTAEGIKDICEYLKTEIILGTQAASRVLHYERFDFDMIQRLIEENL